MSFVTDVVDQFGLVGRALAQLNAGLISLKDRLFNSSGLIRAELLPPPNAKQPVAAASTANVTLATPGATLDGVTLTNPSRILLKDQTAPAQNGVYVWTGSAVALTRATDFDDWSEVVNASVYVSAGTVNANSTYLSTSAQTGTIGTTAITFVLTAKVSVGAYTASTGLALASNAFSISEATLAEAQAATSGGKVMTPRRAKDFLLANAPRLTPASEGVPTTGDATAAMQAFITKCVTNGYVADLSRAATYTCTQLTIPSGFRSVGVGAVFRADNTLNGEPEPRFIETAGNVWMEALRISLPGTTTTKFNGQGGSLQDSWIGLLEVKADSRHQAGGINPSGSNWRIDRFICDNVDYAAGINQARTGETLSESADATIGEAIITRYRLGVRIDKSVRCGVDSLSARIASSAATKDPGNNGLLLQGVNDARFGTVLVENAGEHGVRIGGSDAVQKSINFGTITTRRTGGCGFKINPNAFPVIDVYVGYLDVEDNGNNVTGGNAEGLRINDAQDVVIDTMRLRAVTATFCQSWAVFINNVTGFHINNADLSGMRNGVIAWDPAMDSVSPGTGVSNITINGKAAVNGSTVVGHRTGATGSDTYAVDGVALNLNLSGTYTRLISGFTTSSSVSVNNDTVLPLTGPLSVEGRVATGSSLLVGGIQASSPNLYANLRQDGKTYIGNPRDWSVIIRHSPGESVSGIQAYGSVELLEGNFVAANGYLSLGGNKVVGNQMGGWEAIAGTAQRTAFNTDTVSLINLARAFKALKDDLQAHGLIANT